MNKSNFDTLFKDYVDNYSKPGHEDREKIILAICDTQPELLIMPCCDKSCYGPAAELIVKMGYEKFKNHIGEVFVWVQDLNWPSADIIAEFLASIPRDELIEHLKNTLRIAYEEKDDCWISGIRYVIERAKLSKCFLDDDEFKKILEFGDCSDEDEKETYESPYSAEEVGQILHERAQAMGEYVKEYRAHNGDMPTDLPLEQIFKNCRGPWNAQYIIRDNKVYYTLSD